MRAAAVFFSFLLFTASAFGGEEFITSYWYGPPVKFTSRETYQRIKDANFNVVFPPGPIYGAVTKEQNLQILDLCQQLGLKAVIDDPRMPRGTGGLADAKAKIDAIVADYSKHPALLAYFIVDEPSAGDFAKLGEVVAYLKERDPRHPGYINLFPTYATPGAQLGTNTYEDYLAQFVKAVDPFVISFDHYPLIKGYDRADYLPNLAQVRNASLTSHKPFWNIAQCVEHFEYRQLTEPEFRYQAMQTLAFGGRGLLWYTYWYPGEPKATIKHAMIKYDGTPDEPYEWIKAVNADARAIGNELSNAESWAVIESSPAGFTTPANCPIHVDAIPLTTGIFKSKDGQIFALVTNRNYREPAKAGMTVEPFGAPMERFDPAMKKWSTVATDKPRILLDLPAGGGVLLKWKSK